MKPLPILGAKAARASSNCCNGCLSGNYINQMPLRHRAALLNGVSVRARSSGRDFRRLSRGGHLIGPRSTCLSRAWASVVQFRSDRKREGAGGDTVLAAEARRWQLSRGFRHHADRQRCAVRREIPPDSVVLTDGGGSSGPV